MINFMQNRSSHYALVQTQLLKSIQKHIPREHWTSSREVRRTGKLNFALFLRMQADVVMSHGIADKNYFGMLEEGTERVYANKLKAIFVPGPWLKRKWLADPTVTLREDQIHTVGWPRLEVLRAKPVPPRLSDRPNILWAPTHDFRKRGEENESTSTFPKFGEHLPQLETMFDMATSLHPRNRDAKEPTVDGLLMADAVVSDFGTMVYEAWALGKPVIFPRWILKDRIQQYLETSAEAYIFEKRIGYHPESLDEMIDIVKAGPVITPDVEAFMDDYCDNYRGGDSGKVIADLLVKMGREKAERIAAKKAAAKVETLSASA